MPDTVKPYTLAEMEALPDYVLEPRRLLATAREGARDSEAGADFTMRVVMQAIGRTVRLCSMQESAGIPGEARVIDYAKVLDMSVGAVRAAGKAGEVPASGAVCEWEGELHPFGVVCKPCGIDDVAESRAARGDAAPRSVDEMMQRVGAEDSAVPTAFRECRCGERGLTAHAVDCPAISTTRIAPTGSMAGDAAPPAVTDEEVARFTRRLERALHDEPLEASDELNPSLVRLWLTDFVAARATASPTETTGRSQDSAVEATQRRDWRYDHIRAHDEYVANVLSSDLGIAIARVDDCLTNLGRRGGAGVWMENETLLAMRLVLESVRSPAGHGTAFVCVACDFGCDDRDTADHHEKATLHVVRPSSSPKSGKNSE